MLVHFPFSDLSRTKLRPAVILADVGRGDFLLCQVTSQPYADPQALLLDNEAFESGTLQRQSFARPGKLFTASSTLISRSVGKLTQGTRAKLATAIAALIYQGLPPARD